VDVTPEGEDWYVLPCVIVGPEAVGVDVTPEGEEWYVLPCVIVWLEAVGVDVTPSEAKELASSRGVPTVRLPRIKRRWRRSSFWRAPRRRS
jgi:hypothetical protein